MGSIGPSDADKTQSLENKHKNNIPPMKRYIAKSLLLVLVLCVEYACFEYHIESHKPRAKAIGYSILLGRSAFSVVIIDEQYPYQQRMV